MPRLQPENRLSAYFGRRPRIITSIAERLPALFGFLPGMEARGIADICTRLQPNGKLPISYPRNTNVLLRMITNPSNL